MKGCLFACLIKSELDADEGLSLTLWDTRKMPKTTSAAEMFQVNMQEITPYLQVSNEWKAQLSKDMSVEYNRYRGPVVTSYRTMAQFEEKLPMDMMYLRLLSLKIQPGKMDEFVNIYQQESCPVEERTGLPLCY